jgi:hypothetical protein
MDAELLRGRGVTVLAQVRARLEDHRLVLGARATLVRAPGSAAYGMLMRLPADDLERLYAESSVASYRPEAVQVSLESGATVPALCYKLAAQLSARAPSAEYARQLLKLGVRLGLPEDYLAAIAQAAAASGEA